MHVHPAVASGGPRIQGRIGNIMGTQDWAGMGVSDIAMHPDDPNNILAATGDSDFGSALRCRAHVYERLGPNLDHYRTHF